MKIFFILFLVCCVALLLKCGTSYEFSSESEAEHEEHCNQLDNAFECIKDEVDEFFDEDSEEEINNWPEFFKKFKQVERSCLKKEAGDDYERSLYDVAVWAMLSDRVLYSCIPNAIGSNDPEKVFSVMFNCVKKEIRQLGKCEFFNNYLNNILKK